MPLKYELTSETLQLQGHTLYRIRAVRDILRHGVQKGDLGGWIEKEENLSQEGDCWVREETTVWEKARVLGNAWVSGSARIYGNACVFGKALVFGHACVYGNACVSGDAWVFGSAWVYGNSKISGTTQLGSGTHKDIVSPESETHEAEANTKESVEKKESVMSKTNEAAVRAAKRGAKVAGSTTVAEICVQQVRKALGKHYPKFLDTPMMKSAEPFLVAYVLHLVSTQFGSTIPQAGKVAAIAEYAMEGSSRDALGPLLGQLGAVFEKLGGIEIPETEE